MADSKSIDTRKEHLTFGNQILIDKIIDAMKVAKNPLFFFHDDADGICSFLSLYHYMREGKGICVKSKCCVDMRFSSVLKQYDPDYIFVLDLAQMDQEFIDLALSMKKKIIWIDHHDLHDISDFVYYNPKLDCQDINYPASYVCFKIVSQILESEDKNYKVTDLYKKLLWIATAGTVSDWFVPDFISEFISTYPKIVTKDTFYPPEIIFDTPLSKIIQFFNFALKGSTMQVNANIREIMTIKDIDEIFLGEDKGIKKILRNIKPFVVGYDRLLDKFIGELENFKEKIFFSEYVADMISLTSAVSNELLYRYPDKVLIIARLNAGSLKGSIRSEGIPIRDVLLETLEDISGYGGGHEVACGFCIDAGEKDKFISLFKENFNKKYP